MTTGFLTAVIIAFSIGALVGIGLNEFDHWRRRCRNGNMRS